MTRIKAVMDFYDSLTVEEAALIGEYGFDRAVRAMRQFPTTKAAKAFLEEERKALQVSRYGGRK